MYEYLKSIARTEAELSKRERARAKRRRKARLVACVFGIIAISLVFFLAARGCA